MKCQFVRPIFEKNGFCIYVYHTEDSGVPQGARDGSFKGPGYQFTAKGNNLPSNKLTDVDLQGNWEKNSHGLQYIVDYYEELKPQSIEGIESYLSSGMIKGIGPKTAKLIVEKYGTRTFEILDDYPESLLEIKGITRKKLDKILSAYQDSHAVRDLAAYLTPFKVTPKKIRKIYEHFGNAALDVVKNQPFALCEISGFGFLTVDEIARANHCRPNEPLRIEGCIGYCMELEMQNGNLYADKQKFQKQVHEQLNRGYAEEVVTEVEVYKVMYQMVHDKALYYEDGALYSAKLYHFETQAAKDLATLLVQTYMPPAGLEDLITQAQKDLKLLLSDKQVEAVKKAFTNLVSIITGGPGTGKTTVQRVLLYISEKLGEEKILLTAPTGRASRRMAESTGKSEALTLHSALGLNNDEECEAADEMLSEDFIIADEFTMADMRLSYELFKHIEKGVRVVIVGDVDQLPSVGPGNVFRELVLCGVIPVTTLDMVFRQGKDSRIAANAHKMQENDTNLDYGDDFIFCPADTAAEAADKVAEYYRSFVDAYGVDNVQVLTPFRKKGEASVNALNDRLWEMVNPKSSIARELKAGNALYREGDRIIHNKNKNDISNGDIGYITDIYQDEDGVDLMRLSFSDGRIVEYSAEDADLIEHAYATTVHKSQGSEYKVVILPWLPMFYMMLRRNILYTAITRAKEKIVIVGSKKALYQAIHNTACDKRNTRLGERIVREYNALLTKKASA